MNASTFTRRLGPSNVAGSINFFGGFSRGEGLGETVPSRNPSTFTGCARFPASRDNSGDDVPRKHSRKTAGSGVATFSRLPGVVDYRPA
ncbi:hypothetical protein FKM82_030369 [Ascaphus truei]